MTSVHFVLGRPRLHFPWDGFYRYSHFGIPSVSIRSKYPTHFNLQFLIKEAYYLIFRWGGMEVGSE